LEQWRCTLRIQTKKSPILHSLAKRPCPKRKIQEDHKIYMANLVHEAPTWFVESGKDRCTYLYPCKQRLFPRLNLLVVTSWFEHLRIKFQSSDFFRSIKFCVLLFLFLHSSSSTFKLLFITFYGSELLLDSSSTWSGVFIHLFPSPFSTWCSSYETCLPWIFFINGFICFLWFDWSGMEKENNLNTLSLCQSWLSQDTKYVPPLVTIF